MAILATQSIDVDLTPGGVSPFLYVSQGDYGTRNLVFNLYNNGQTYTIPSSVRTIVLGGVTKSGYAFQITCSFSTNGTTATSSLTADMTSTVGLDMCQLVLKDASGNRLGTANVFIAVEPSPFSAKIMYGSVYWADLAKSWAVGGTGLRGGEDTNNSKYWSDTYRAQAEALASRLTADEVTIADHGNRLTSAETRIASAENRLTNGESRMTAAETRITNNTTRIIKNEKNIKELRDDFIEHEDWAHSHIDKAVALKTIYLVDKDGKYLVDNNGNRLTGGIYLPVTDKTGELDGYPADSVTVGKTFLMGFKNMGLPVLYLNHPDIETLKTKADGELSDVGVIYTGVSPSINTTLKKLKVQGATSQGYPKKNYTITFNNDVIIRGEWGSHKKYVLKADWVDFSHMRNEIGAKLWGQIRRTRVDQSNVLVDNDDNYFVNSSGDYLAGETEPAMSAGVNFGAIDAFPIFVVINDKYWGLYSFTIPKDDWMAGMNGSLEKETIISAETSSVPTAFKRTVLPPNEDGEMIDSGSSTVVFSVEYTKNKSSMSWISDSLNTLINAADAEYGTDEEYLNAISPYIDVDSVIDYYIFICMLNDEDGIAKNYLLDTWDGTKWYFAAYDLDGTFGNVWNGKSYYDVRSSVTFSDFSSRNRLMQIIYEHNKTALKERYSALRSSILTDENLSMLVWNYAVNIPRAAYDYEAVRWPTRPGTATNNHEQILRYFNLRCKVLDAEINTL